MLEVALDCIRRGWYVFPCKPRGKTPIVPGGFKAATLDEATIRAWWRSSPDANVGIATGASGLCVLDCDHGIGNFEEFSRWAAWLDIPNTYSVRTGRRPEFGVQLYFSGSGLKSIAWEDGGVSGDIRCDTGYVMAPGSVHPSGEKYEAIVTATVQPVPAYVRALKPAQITGTHGQANAAVTDDGKSPISDHRNVHMISLLGRKRNEGADDDALREYAEEVNEARFDPPLSESELDKLVENACKFPMPEVAPEVLIGGKVAGKPEPPADWRSRYHTLEETENVPPPSFLIDQFLMLDSITALAAPVGQRKSLISLNVAHALCTGEALFGHFAVARRPSRVLYLCPEMGLASFASRLRLIGLLPFVGKTLFFMTMNSAMVELDELTDEELSGAVVIIDTAVRYLKGDENSSEDMRAFAQSVFRLKKAGGGDGAVLLLHHSAKGTKETSDLSLENAMRGSGELGAFVTSCWATRLQKPDEPYQSASYVTNVKQRDFESEPFEVTSGPDCRMHYVPRAEGAKAVLEQRNKGNVANKDGQDDAALAYIKANARKTGRELSAGLLELGIKRSADWCNKKKKENGWGQGVKTGN